VTDVPGVTGTDFVVYAHQRKSALRVSRDQRLPVELDTLEWELFTIIPVIEGIAPIGLLDQLNSGGAVVSNAFGPERFELTLRDGGLAGVWTERRPTRVRVDGREVTEFAHRSELLSVDVPRGGPRRLELEF
jgi:raffinose synthase